MNAVLKTGAIAAILLLARTAPAADKLGGGKITNLNADKQSFVLRDAEGKDFTFKFDDKYVVNRGGKESQGELRVGDSVWVHYDKGLVNSTAKYIVVNDGDSANWRMSHGSFKGYDSAAKQVTVTDPDKNDFKFGTADAAVRLNHEKADISELKIGDHVLAVLDGQNVKFLIAERK